MKTSFIPTLCCFFPTDFTTVKLSGKLYSAIMSTGRICPCTRDYKDLANPMNSVGKSLMNPAEGQKQSGKKSINKVVTFSTPIYHSSTMKYFSQEVL